MLLHLRLRLLLGSPPQVRGKQLKRLTIKRRDRITPAGAGKTPPEARDCAMLRDHPRRCGENSSASSSLIPHQGSPPQVRGKHKLITADSGITGITPAGAGKTSIQQRDYTILQDHPRRCGENPSVCVSLSLYVGSPPQVRGKPQYSLKDWITSRITPAGAGKTKGKLFTIIL